MHKAKKALLVGAVTVALAVSLTACGNKQAAMQPKQVPVLTMHVIQKDTPMVYEFVGEVEARDEVPIKANVSGTVIAKHVKGGEYVTKGQPLFTIDARQYEATTWNARAQLADARATLSRVQRDVARYETLASQNAIARQTLDNIRAEEQQALAQVEARSASLNQAEVDLNDTLVRSPIDGKLDTKDISIGTYAKLGDTVLATVSSTDPVRVKFSISENEYIKLVQARQNLQTATSRDLELTLSDGTVYKYKGKVEQVDRALSSNTGTLTIKAVFDNPDGLLVPGMFARLKAQGDVRPNALLVPQKAVQELLDKTFISVVNAEGKSEMRAVKMGARIGNLWLVESGLQAGDVIIVEGFQKAPTGTPVAAKEVTLEELYKKDAK
ncbi:efflux RND transporter periplasmic adaptor subunit [Succinispira mobilis]|uniref:efflux RND transporter periplasmic adaptor subunit n=1 Tax=Succinispira mobilis TaxID=78120 RepID=UPI0003723FFF|nr:efflux RND transporter periplasmic adaptor subunit [Succinispira mobilis]